MPTTLLSLVLFVVLLLPGFAYTLRRERLASTRTLSPFRETVSLAFVSIVADAAALAGFALVRAAMPRTTPAVTALLHDPNYRQAHFGDLVGWGAGLLAAATLLATAAAGNWPRRQLTRLRRRRVPVPVREHEARVSSWTLLFTEHPDARIHVGCVLDDGSYVSGWLRSFSRAAEDVEDRELTLTAPILYRAPDRNRLSALPDVGAVAISARRLQLLTVSYITP